MNDFEIIKTNGQKMDALIIMKTSEAPFAFLSQLQERLVDICFDGKILIDELLHSGNNEERFIKGYFNGKNFEDEQFDFEIIEPEDCIRCYMCQYLKKDVDALLYSCLDAEEQEKILEGACI